MSNVPKNLEYYPRDPELYGTSFGRELWEFMKRSENVKLMEDAASQERPAVEPLQDGLLNEFGPQFEAARRTRTINGIKKMIGDMARQIMGEIDYRFKESGIPVRGSLFSTGSVYCKRR